MTKTLGDFSVAAQMRDVIKKIATRVVNDMRPRDEYGVVLEIDRTKRRCRIQLPGDDPNGVWFPMGAIQPSVLNQKVRVAGPKGDRYIADVLGSSGAYSSGGTFTTAGTGSTSTTTTVTPIIPYARSGILTVTTGITRFRFPFTATLLGVSAVVTTAPTGAAIIVDVNKNGTSVFTNPLNRPQILAGNSSTVSEVVPDTYAVTNGDYLTVDVDQVGSTVAGSDLSVFIRYRQS